MGKAQRIARGGLVYHVLNRANGRRPPFRRAGDFAAFEGVMWGAGQGELDTVRCSVARGRPFGAADWTRRMARKLGLESTLRRPGRPRKEGSA